MAREFLKIMINQKVHFPSQYRKSTKSFLIRNEEDDSDQRGGEEEEEEEGENEDEDSPAKIPSSRSARGNLEIGLKVLSVRVHEIVCEKFKSTYKEVADLLINELALNGKLETSGMKPNKESVKLRKTKDEKNVRRRVYDALNVLIAAGIIKKEGKVN